ncbi:hypothetical protein BDN72DRAFT_957630 [Pluteus cervinus]|uniref:Uncharacterized protein n=1 Tax=Pluteus cervinus TaxID=181527 RepID=A0ACD3B4Z7_9AGAR|nr:hypothetical protein BDN72DRAFT_957630 [Pluteus cervinus]
MKSSPQLPAEILGEIIFRAWRSPMNNNERIDFMTTSMMVNKTWQSSFLFVSGKDIHIPCQSYIPYLRSRRTSSNVLCQTASIRVQADTSPAAAQDLNICLTPTHPRGQVNRVTKLIPRMPNTTPRMCKALSSFLYLCWREPEFLPNLHTLSIHYSDIPFAFDDLLDRLVTFPDRVGNLDLSFSFSNLQKGQASTQDIIIHSSWALELPFLKGLSICRGSEIVVGNMKVVCPNLEQLVVDGEKAEL